MRPTFVIFCYGFLPPCSHPKWFISPTHLVSPPPSPSLPSSCLPPALNCIPYSCIHKFFSDSVLSCPFLIFSPFNKSLCVGGGGVRMCVYMCNALYFALYAFAACYRLFACSTRNLVWFWCAHVYSLCR